MSPKVADNVFRRFHSLQAPPPEAELPILMEDNPSRDFIFPLTANEALKALHALPKNDTEGITHLWLRRVRKSDYVKGELPWAQYICGRGVRVIVLFPWPRDMLLRMGKKKPSPNTLKYYKSWKPELIEDEQGWALKWDLAALRRFYVEHLLYHEVGHHVDWYRRHWSKANRASLEEFADQYAISKTATATYVFNALEKKRKAE